MRVSNYFFATVPHSSTILRILQLAGATVWLLLDAASALRARVCGLVFDFGILRALACAHVSPLTVAAYPDPPPAVSRTLSSGDAASQQEVLRMTGPDVMSTVRDGRVAGRLFFPSFLASYPG